jgi:hypothetical protein
MRVHLVLRAALLLAATAVALPAQRRGGGGGGFGGGGSRNPPEEPNVPYDGRFAYVRVRYDIPNASFGRVDVKWKHDYPRGERHFAKVMSELSTIRTWKDGSNILTLDDPALTRHPIAFLTEPGFWRPKDSEIVGLRNYLAKGGFIVFDDFAGEHWMNFEEQMRKVLPSLRPVELTLSHPIFDSFYKIKTLNYEHPYYRGLKSVFYAYFEENDPTKRMLAMVNYNNDISEYWEFSDTGMFPMDGTNEAYKLGVNYIIYALTR